MKKIGFLFALAFAIVFSSCKMAGDLQIEKRHYGKGYYVHVRDNCSNAVVVKNETSVAIPNENDALPNNIDEKDVAVENNSSAFVQTSKSIKEAHPSNRSFEPKATLMRNENKKISFPVNKTPQFVSPKHKSPSEPAGDVSQIVLVILALVLSPLAIFLKEGVTTRFWIDLICWLLGAGVVGFFFYGGGLLLFAIVFALLIVFDVL